MHGHGRVFKFCYDYNYNKIIETGLEATEPMVSVQNMPVCYFLKLLYIKLCSHLFMLSLHNGRGLTFSRTVPRRRTGGGEGVEGGRGNLNRFIGEILIFY